MLAQLLLENFTTLCLLVGLGIIATTNKNLDERTNNSFIAFIWLVVLLTAADMADSYLAKLTYPTVWRYLTSAAGYTIRPASLMLFISILLRRKRTNMLLWLPVLILGLIAFSSYFTHLMFWFDAGNDFVRGPLGFLSHILSGAYLAALVFLTLKMHRHITAGEIFTVLYVAGICVLATYLESVLSDCKFLLNGAMAVSCALYYVVLYIETYRRDPLTGLMNRRSFYLEARRRHNQSLAVISIDMNCLKEINDSQGHSHGDDALQKVANVLLDNSGRLFYPCRIGGDEFMVLGRQQNESLVNGFIETVRRALAESGLTASIGWAFYSPGDCFDDVCIKADSLMYADKKNYRHRQNQRLS